MTQSKRNVSAVSTGRTSAATKASSNTPKAAGKSKKVVPEVVTKEIKPMRGTSSPSIKIDEAGLWPQVAISDEQLARVLLQLPLLRPDADSASIPKKAPISGPVAEQRKSVDIFDAQGNIARSLSDADVARIAEAIGVSVGSVKTSLRQDADQIGHLTPGIGIMDKDIRAGYKSSVEDAKVKTDDRSPVARTLDETDDSLSELLAAWCGLVKKLEPILPAAGVEGIDDSQREISASPLHDRLLSQGRRIEDMIGYIKHIARNVTAY